MSWLPSQIAPRPATARDSWPLGVPGLALSVVGLLLSIFAGCGPGPDPYARGAICTPATPECPRRTTVTRETGGANVLDVTIRNRGPQSTVSLDVDVTGQLPTLDATGDLQDATSPTPPTDSTFPVSYSVRPGAEVDDRFVPAEVTTRDEFRIGVRCAPCADCEAACDIRVDYVAMSRRVTCENDDDCRSDWYCDRESGRCVACRTDDDCRPDQACDRASGRCLPPADRGCSTSAPLPSPVGILLLALVVLSARRLRDDPPRRLQFVALSLPLAAGTLLAAPDRAGAQSSPYSKFSVGAGPRFVTGRLAEDARRGLGLELAESLRWRWIGGTAWIQTSYFLTTQQSPPHLRELHVFGFGLGPTVHRDFGRFSVAGTAAYQRIGFASNSLVRRTGLRQNYHAAGGRLGASYRWAPLFVGVGVEYFAVFDVPASLLGVNVRFGLTTR